MKYADIRTNLDIHPVSGDLIPIIDENAISNQIRNLIFTDFYETPWNPSLGAGVPQTLFDNFGNETESRIRRRITDTINKYVKRAKLIRVDLKYDNLNGYAVSIVYQPVNQLEPVTMTLILKRTR